MGKNKGGNKKPNIFKVAGAKSLKAKSKAKPVTGNLKKINEIVQTNIGKINKNFVHLRNHLIQKRDENVKAKPNQKKNMTDKKKASELEKEELKTLDKLSNIQF